jgi:hypothetical protein
MAVLMGRLAPAAAPESAELAAVTVDYPEEGSIFPPDFSAPTFLWRDAAPAAKAWLIEIAFADGSAALRVKAPGERMRVGEIDPRCVSPSNELPQLTPQQAASLSWMPDAATWAAIQKHSVGHPAKITITGFRDKAHRKAVSRGGVAIQTSPDPVGAPIFYRDVPLMPSEGEKGVIKPLADNGIALIAWRLRNVGEPRSRVVLEGLHTCANCHSFSADGKTLGMDLDGPQNDKGLYAIAPVSPKMSIRNEDVITWNTFQDPNVGRMRVGFMSQISPDGQYVVTTVATEKDLFRNYYVANFKNYRFLQVFYATRGRLVWYSRATGKGSLYRARTTLAMSRPARSGVRTANTWSSSGPKPGTPTPNTVSWPNSPMIPMRRRFSTTSTGFPLMEAGAARLNPSPAHRGTG